MKSKKSESANLENGRPTFLLIGLIFSLGMVLQSFEWLRSSIIIKPISGLESETLYEPIREIIVVKPKPKNNSQPKKTKNKAEVVVTKKLEVKTIENKKIIDKTPVKINTEIAFEIDSTIGDFEGDELGEEPETDSTYQYVELEEVPEFIGGEKAMLSFIGNNLKYPNYSKRVGNSGRVFVSFVIDKQGNVTDVDVVKGVDKHIDAEAKRVIKKMPKWKPGKQRNRLVRVRYTIPVNFVLR